MINSKNRKRSIHDLILKKQEHTRRDRMNIESNSKQEIKSEKLNKRAGKNQTEFIEK